MKNCSVEGCDGNYYSKGYCSKHYMQIKLYGKILERTKFDPNEFIIDGDICWVILYNNKCVEIARAKFLTIHYKYISDPRLKWHLIGKYVGAIWIGDDGEKHHIFLHQAIAQLSDQVVQPEEEIDHKDGNPLNNLDDNLRICTRSQNQANRDINKNNTSGWKGVSWHKKSGNWEAYIYNSSREHLGTFVTKEDAARAYNAAALKYFGEFAVLNNI